MDSLLFEDMELSPKIKKAIRDLGFEETTPIQSLVIPPIM